MIEPFQLFRAGYAHAKLHMKSMNWVNDLGYACYLLKTISRQEKRQRRNALYQQGAKECFEVYRQDSSKEANYDIDEGGAKWIANYWS